MTDEEDRINWGLNKQIVSNEPLTEAERCRRHDWLRRYERRFIEIANLTLDQAQLCATAETFETLSEGFEDDPEGAADMEMSYWEP